LISVHAVGLKMKTFVLNYLVVIFIFAISCNSQKQSGPKLFTLLDPNFTGVQFQNTLTETNKFHIIEYLYFYNGGGVAAGDINNDGLVDLYFSANQLPNRLYLNKGDLQFEDITQSAGVAGAGDWSTGVTMADVNGDGFLDIYLCQLGDYKHIKGKNQLFINQGNLTFVDQASQYGLDYKGFSTQAAFFDYDLDGDLDMYLLNHAVHTERSYGPAEIRKQFDSKAGDRLFRQDWKNSQPFFADVTREAGIFSSHIGYGLAVTAGDLNQDGCTDLYVSNDFHENDYLYINNCDGTFSEKLTEFIPHSSRFSMGNDLADFNNDGKLDIMVLDMFPDKEEVLKKSVGEQSIETYNLKLNFGYHHQLARNTLQLNLGNGHFSEIALLTDLYATDWSWSPLFCDMDNDGNKDLYITNGIVKRPNDLDYVNFLSNQGHRLYQMSPQDSVDRYLIKLMPSDKIANYAFQNLGDLSFKNLTSEWGLEQPAFSNGACYADLDNDGDLELIVNNINEKAFIYQNNSETGSNNYLQVQLKGAGKNTQGVGTKVILRIGKKILLQEQMPTRGFMSSVDPILSFGLGAASIVDSLAVIWPNGALEKLSLITVNQRLVLEQVNAKAIYNYKIAQLKPWGFEDISEEAGIDFKHRENNFIDYNREYLMPHKLSTEGPKLAIGDINGDGLDDFYIGGARNQPGAVFFQNNDGKFIKSPQVHIEQDRMTEDVGAALFDADGDGDLDLYVSSGGNEWKEGHPYLKDRLYINNGLGQLVSATHQLPEIFVNGSCVKPSDFDLDGDIDLYVGSRSVPGQYGKAPKSQLLVNDGKGNFTESAKQLASGLSQLGMVTDAIWSDFDNDQQIDLLVVGEWLPISVFKNHGGRFIEVTNASGLTNTQGWWNTITAGDFDQDGDVDYLVGNLGLNAKIKANPQEPATLYLKDFDQNGSLDHILCFYKNGKSMPFATKDELVKQIVSLKKKFVNYRDYARVQSIQDIFSPEQLADAVIKKAHTFHSSYLQNLGNGKFNIQSLPLQAQFSPVYTFLVNDYNQDGTLDVLLAGNFDGATINFGKYDAGYGLLLSGDGKGNFTSIDPVNSNIVIKGDTRDMKELKTAQGDRIIMVAKSDKAMQVFRFSSQIEEVSLEIP